MKVLNNFALIFTHESLVSECLQREAETDNVHLIDGDEVSNQTKLSLSDEQGNLIKTMITLMHHALDRYHLSQVYYKPNLFIFTGDFTLLSNRLIQSIQSEFTIPCCLFNPFIKIDFANLAEIKHLKRYGHHLAMCCGLALATWKKTLTDISIRR